MPAFILILSKIWGFFKKNPGLILAIALGGVIIWFLVSFQKKTARITELETQVINFQKDTLARGREANSLRYDTSVYMADLKDLERQINDLQAFDKKHNPNLEDKLPDINILKTRNR